MKFRSLGRLGLGVAALSCLFAAFSASAFGAGKPIFNPFGNGITSGGSVTPNQVELASTVNPNGAATTLTIQYREVGTSVWLTAVSKEIGSGTSEVKITGQAFPLAQNHHYEAQATATNSYGTVTTTENYGHTEKFGVRWNVSKGIFTSAYINSGSLKIDWFSAGNGYKIECAESGSGEFGPEAVEGQHENITASSCTYYINNIFTCNSKNTDLKLNNVFQAEYKNMQYCSGEEVQHTLSFPEAFHVSTENPYEPLVTRPVTMTTKALMNNNIHTPATVTVTSNWQLTGANVGKKFSVIWTE